MNPIIDKVRKLLNLANDESASEGERDNAMRMAHAFLAKHNLTMTAVDQAGGTTEKRGKQNQEFYGRPWARSICNSIAELFFCEYFITHSHTKNMAIHCFVGKESNATTALEMSKYLVDSVRKEANREMKRRGEGVPWRRSFSTGAAARIRQRVAEIKKASETQATEISTGTSLVLANVYQQESAANQAFIASIGTKLRTMADRSKPAGSGYSQGHEYGGKLSLNTQLNGTTHGKLMDNHD